MFTCCLAQESKFQEARSRDARSGANGVATDGRCDGNRTNWITASVHERGIQGVDVLGPCGDSSKASIRMDEDQED